MPRAATSVHIRKRTVVVRQGVAKSNELGQKHQLTINNQTITSIITSTMKKKRRKNKGRTNSSDEQTTSTTTTTKIDGDK